MSALLRALGPFLGLFALLVLACQTATHPLAPVLAPAASGSSPAPVTAAALPPKVPVAPPPVALTASDGTGLELVTLDARGVIDGPLALTEMELSFDNPRDETMEGRFEIRLPPGATITRFAMEIGGRWQEAEVVEKQRARRTYETFLHQQRDPALLERDAGNRFRARVFPIAPRARKRLMVSYTQVLVDPRDPYRLSVAGLPPLERLDLQVRIEGEGGAARTERVHREHQASEGDLVVPTSGRAAVGMRRGERVVARVQPLAGVDLGESEPLGRLTVLFDTSASRALELHEDVQRVADLLGALARRHGSIPLTVMAFDQEVVTLYEGPLEDFGPSERSALLARRPLGASNLEHALGALAQGEHPRVLLVGDGLVSAGTDSEAELRTTLATVAEAGVRRLDALAVGGVRDDERLRALVTGPLPASGVVLHADASPAHNAARLLQPTVDGVTLHVPGARWWSPTTLDGLQPGESVVLYAQLPESEPLQLRASGPVEHEQRVELQTSDSPLMDHAWMSGRVAADIAKLARLDDATGSDALRQQIIQRSVEHRILTDFTALLVLETEQDYARFGLERRALRDILAVGPGGGAQLLQRRDPPVVAVRSPMVGMGSIRGRVTDVETGEEVDGAIVIVDCLCLSEPRQIETNDRGIYGVRDLPAGPYTVQVLVGDADITKEMNLPRNAAMRVNFRVSRDDSVARTITVEVPDLGNETRRGTLDAVPGGGPDAPMPSSNAPPPSDAEGDFVRESTSVGRTVSMEEFRNIPVGSSTSRDFTQVVESSATASRDAAGISLAGTTGAESRYALDGLNVPTPASRTRRARVSLRRVRVDGGGLSSSEFRSYAEAQLSTVEDCYFRELGEHWSLRGRMSIELRLGSDGRPISVRRRGHRALDASSEMLRCIERALLGGSYPAHGAGSRITATLAFRPFDGPPSGMTGEVFNPTQTPGPTVMELDDIAYEGSYGEIRRALDEGQTERAWQSAWRWREEAPVDLMALVALGEAAQAVGELRLAARAYGSILDLHPSRADMRRFAAGRLESLEDPAALGLAVDAYGKAVEQRPDHPNSHRSLAFALLARGEAQAAFEALEEGLRQRYPQGRFAEVQRVLHEDLGIVAAAWRRQSPADAQTIRARLDEHGAALATQPSLRFVLSWETDANDVDLHLYDGIGGHAFYSEPELRSGGRLYADVTTGFGPECFGITGKPRGFPYRLAVHYYARGPMGYGMGKVQVVHHDGKGGVRLEDRPFVVMKDDAYVDLGTVSTLRGKWARGGQPVPLRSGPAVVTHGRAER